MFRIAITTIVLSFSAACASSGSFTAAPAFPQTASAQTTPAAPVAVVEPEAAPLEARSELEVGTSVVVGTVGFIAVWVVASLL